MIDCARRHPGIVARPPGAFSAGIRLPHRLWLTLDALFVDPQKIAKLVAALADKLRPYAVSAVCGPLQGGAFLAQALATTLDTNFYFTAPQPAADGTGLFQAEYHLPPELRRRVRGARVAVIDDVISAGSSVRATVAALTAAGATTVVVAALLVLGDAGITHFSERGVPVETLARREFVLWDPGGCPLCQAGSPLEDPGEAAK